MTFKQVATYFATVVLTSALAVVSISAYMVAVNPADRWSSLIWAFISFTLVTITATLVGVIGQYDYEQRKR